MDELKVRLVKVAVSIIAATCQHGIGDAVAEQGFQPDGKIQVIQIFQKAVASDAAQLIQIIGQIVLRNDLAHGTNLFHKGSPSFFGQFPHHLRNDAGADDQNLVV